MMRWTLVGLGFLLVLASAFALSLDYGSSDSVSYELNDSLAVTIRVNDVPAHVHGVYVRLSDGLEGHVYCAPGMDTEDDNVTWDAEFTCILLPGSYSGTLYFKPTNIDENYESRADTTKLDVSVSLKEVWYTAYGATGVGGTLTAGEYKIEVDDAETVTAEVTVYKGTAPVWAGMVFIGQELEISDTFHIVYNGYSEKKGLAFFTIKSRTPIAVSSSQEQLYLAVPSLVYMDESNRARLDIVTNCSQVRVCVDSNCFTRDVPDTHVVSVTLSRAGDYTVSCVGADLEKTVSVSAPIVVTKTVTEEVKQDPNQVCPAWFYNLPADRKASMCGAVPTRPSYQSSQGPNWYAIGLILALVVGYFVYTKYFKKRKGFEEPEKEIEAVPEMEG